jgi:hypothetical protein
MHAWHTPATQVSPTPGQTWPHEPQLFTSADVSMQPVEQLMYGDAHTHAPAEQVSGLAQAAAGTHAPVGSHVCGVFPLQPASPGVHATQPPFWQTGVDEGHDPQFAPQCVASVLVSYMHGVDPPHPLNPGLHWAAHAPPVHVAAPLAGGWHARQVAPQWVGSSAVE